MSRLKIRRRVCASVLGWLSLGVLAGCHDSDGGGSGDETLMVEHWNEIAVNASGLDHTPGFLQQPGPGRASRAMAIVHIAVYEVVNALKGGDFQTFLAPPLAAPPAGTSLRAAIGQASHDTLAALFPMQAAAMLTELNDELAKVSAGTAKTQGIAFGSAVAQAILNMRTGDGSELPEPRYGIEYIASPDPGKWRQDPISLHPLALGADWGQVAPFVLTSSDQFRAPVPPDLTSAEYQLAYEEVKVLGGDGITTPTARPPVASEIGIYWAYDGTPSLCAPPRLYNQIAMQIAKERKTGVADMARLLALVNVAMADATLCCWESKYFYEFWRPVTGIREADTDGNPGTVVDASYSPLGAPASNAMGPNFTPPFPAYPSGHATMGGALFQTLRRFYGTDEIEFTFVSDELNGVTLDNNGDPRPLIPRTFSTLSEAEEENGQSRIYLGIHWSFDKTEGIAMGRSAADFVFDNAFLPIP